jgi:hypothetical protein
MTNFIVKHPAVAALAAFTVLIGGGPEDPVADAAAAELSAVEGAAAAGNGSGLTVLGSYPGYVKLAQELGANYFSIPAEEWVQMSATEQWAASRAFLNAAIARGDSLIFSTEFAPAGSFYEREPQYLLEQRAFLGVPPWMIEREHHGPG